MSDAPDGSAYPPADPSTAAIKQGPQVVYAIRRLFLGDTNPDGTGSCDAWKQYGYDIDGIASSRCTANHCRPQPGGNEANIETDGRGGTDNSFGKNLVPVWISLAGNFSQDVNDAMARGAHTLLFAIDRLDAGSDLSGLTGSLYEGAPLGTAPAWDGSDTWPVFCEYLDKCLASGTPTPPANASKMIFTGGYVRDNVLVIHPQGYVDIGLNWLHGWFPLRLHHVVISMRLGTEGQSPRTATQGVISGVMDTQEYVTLIDDHIEDFCRAMPSYVCDYACSGSTKDSVLQQIRAASDIMNDGTQTAGATCDGISVGLGFDAVEVKLGPAVNQQPAEANPCGN